MLATATAQVSLKVFRYTSTYVDLLQKLFSVYECDFSIPQ